MSGTLIIGSGSRLEISGTGVIGGPSTSWAGYDGSNDGANTALNSVISSSTIPVHLSRISDTKVALGYIDISNSSYYTVNILTIGATTITEGASSYVLHSHSAAQTVGLTTTDDEEILTIHKNTGSISSGSAQASLWDVTGTVVTGADTGNSMTQLAGTNHHYTQAGRFGTTGDFWGGATNPFAPNIASIEVVDVTGGVVTTGRGTTGVSSGLGRFFGGQQRESRALGGWGNPPGGRVALMDRISGGNYDCIMMTHDGATTLSVGSAFNLRTVLAGSSTEEFLLSEFHADTDKMICMYNQSGSKDLAVATITLSGNNYSSTGTENVLFGDGEWRNNKSVVKTGPSEALVFGWNSDTNDLQSFVLSATDDNTFSTSTPVVYDNGTFNDRHLMVQVNTNQFLAIWVDGGITRGRVINRT